MSHGDGSFDLLDKDLLAILSGDFNVTDQIESDSLTATQLLNINTQELLPAGPGITCSTPGGSVTVTELVPNPMVTVPDSSSNSNDLTEPVPPNVVPKRPPLTTIDSNVIDIVQPKREISDNGRFALPVSSQQIKDRTTNSIPKKTRDANKWALKVWSDWAKFRNSQPASALESSFPIPEDIGDLDDSMINFWGQRFIMEVKRQDGKDYPPNTLTQIVSGLQRYLTTICNRNNINFFREGSQFSEFRRCIDTRMKELHAQGVGIKSNSSDPVTMEDELQFWESGVFNFDTSVGLSNSVFFYNGKLFGFRGFQEHVSCQADQFEILKDNAKDLRYIKFTPGLRKNSQGGLKSRNTANKPIVHYEQKDRKYSIVDLYERYLSLIPRVGAFYRKPVGSYDENGSPKFGAASIAQHAIKSMIKRFYAEAGIDTSDRKISNHSARVTLCTTLYNKNFPDKAVMSRSKHKSSAVQSYQREQFEILNDISKALEPSVLKPKCDENPLISTVAATTSSCKGIKTESDVKSLNDSSVKNDEDTLIINVPVSVKKVIIEKKDGKKIIIEV
ncbi:zinc finger MYM-type protein 2-like [Mercenaria mercenaria]|uniref:zinc finger MYM-type protein 2-like n=1 Tax=Mercenaria mercenaria TaxID=6596 RepID=UPI00234EA731|nr:zinc finger MYM-type protein 2-like [Mercenaria mercenaria]